MHGEEDKGTKKIDQFALAIAVRCKADAALYKGILGEKDIFEKFLRQANKYSINEHSILN